MFVTYFSVMQIDFSNLQIHLWWLDIIILTTWLLSTNNTLRKKVQKLSLGLYLFKRYTFVPKGCILVN